MKHPELGPLERAVLFCSAPSAAVCVCFIVKCFAPKSVSVTEKMFVYKFPDPKLLPVDTSV